MAVAPTPDNFRAEIARRNLRRAELCVLIGMNPTAWSQFVSGTRPLQGWAAHNIGFAINTACKLKVIDVDMEIGVRTPPRPGKQTGWRKLGTTPSVRQR